MSIRPAKVEDLPQMLEIYRPFVEHTAVSFEYQVPSPENFLQRFRNHVAQFPWLVWEEKGRVFGYAYAGAPWEREAYRWCAESSIYLAPEAQGRGIGKTLYQALEEILLRQGYAVLYALVTTENESSLAFHQAMGFRRRAVFPDCGYKFGRWHGGIWLEKRLSDLELPSAFPCAWDEKETI